MSEANHETVVVIDALVSGVSGDKYLGALLDLGASKSSLERVAKVVAECLPGTKNVRVNASTVERGEIAAKLVTVESNEVVRKREAAVVASAVEKSASRLGLSTWAARFAKSTLDSLTNAESQVHGRPNSEVHLHELGSADTLVDILGTAFLIDELNLTESQWWSTPLPTGTGRSHFSGRDYPNPAPAVAELLRAHGFPINPSKIESELTTPTGAAITANLARNVSLSYPPIRPQKIGYGAGLKELKEAANVLRLVVGRATVTSHTHDEVVVLETNLDDVTGEVLGHAMERLLAAGARDVTIGPIYMKKNRPGHVLSVIADASKSEEFAEIIMKETGSLGVREFPIRRHVSPRTIETEIVAVGDKRTSLSVKAALGAEGRVLRRKVEYQDRKVLSDKTGKSLREIDSFLSKRRIRRR